MNKRLISIKLKDVRESLNMTQEQLAEKAGYSKSHIAMIESGKTDISLKALNKIAAALNVEPKFFLEENKGVLLDEYRDSFNDEEKEFLSRQKSRPWITMASEFDKEGLTPEQVKNLLQMVMNISKNKKPQV